ncbi:WxL domain-containing protein [Carnobacterium maltaromaticum]|uniref:WxL domain-containing protein n=1 Tax=Carnobacterium maltaromaticum TaxID=2751 RepID=UPI00295E339F|nr:WxL domain-containing protein [Carnobacterium maltaromaticum]
MKNKQKKILLCSCSVFSLLFTVDAKALESQSYPSEAKVGLEPGDSTKPHELIRDIWAPTNNVGDLTLDAATGFRFFELKTSSYEEDRLAYAFVSSEEINGEKPIPSKHYTLGAQVTDVRGTGAGWTLSAKITEFSSEKEDGRKLKGALFSIPVSDVYADTYSRKYDLPPSSKAVSFPIPDVELPILVAEKDTGLGSWGINFHSDSRGVPYMWEMHSNGNFYPSGGPSLYIPQGNLTGDYVAAITWSLRDAP